MPKGVSLTISKMIFCGTAAFLLNSCGLIAKNSTEPGAYLKRALSIIEGNALNSDNVNWKLVRAKSAEIASESKTPSDTYKAINYALSELKDHHSFLLDANGKPTPQYSKPEIFDDRFAGKDAESPFITPEEIISTDKGVIGRVVVAEFGGKRESTESADFSRSLQTKISTIAEKKPIGWIVDLRRNGGGNMWPMLVGIGPLLGSGPLGYFESRGKYQTRWFYDGGRAGTLTKRGLENVISKIDNPIKNCRRNAPIAVLIDRYTASSGEAVAIAFKGLPNTRFFGERSAGLSTANGPFELADGAVIWLTTGVDLDRDKAKYYSGVTPDVTVKTSATEDKVVEAASSWISQRQAQQPVDPHATTLVTPLR